MGRKGTVQGWGKGDWIPSEGRVVERKQLLGVGNGGTRHRPGMGERVLRTVQRKEAKGTGQQLGYWGGGSEHRPKDGDWGPGCHPDNTEGEQGAVWGWEGGQGTLRGRAAHGTPPARTLPRNAFLQRGSHSGGSGPAAMRQAAHSGPPSARHSSCSAASEAGPSRAGAAAASSSASRRRLSGGRPGSTARCQQSSAHSGHGKGPSSSAQNRTTHARQKRWPQSARTGSRGARWHRAQAASAGPAGSARAAAAGPSRRAQTGTRTGEHRWLGWRGRRHGGKPGTGTQEKRGRRAGDGDVRTGMESRDEGQEWRLG